MAGETIGIIAFETPSAGRQSRNPTERSEFVTLELPAMRVLALRERAVVSQVVVIALLSIFESNNQ